MEIIEIMTYEIGRLFMNCKNDLNHGKHGFLALL